MVERGQDPSLYRRRLRAVLRKAREEAGFTQRDVAAEMDWSLSKLIRIETGLVTIQTNDLKALLAHYGITDPNVVAGHIETAKKSRERSEWWARYRELISPEMAQFLGYESSAGVIRNFEPLLIPGLLQTEDYARDLFKYLRGPKDQSRIEGLIRLRMERQEMFSASTPPETRFLIDEAAIRRVVGGPHVMRAQLQRLMEMTESPHVSILIVPFDLGMYRGLRVPYLIFEFDSTQDPTILYLETPDGETVIHEDVADDDYDLDVPTPAIHLEMFWELEQVLSPERSVEIIQDALVHLDEGGGRDGGRQITLPIEQTVALPAD